MSDEADEADEGAEKVTGTANEKTLLILVVILSLGLVAEAAALYLVYHPLT